MKSNSKAKAKALKTTRAAALITAATLTLALMFLGCKQPETPEPPAPPPVRYIVLTIGTKNPNRLRRKRLTVLTSRWKAATKKPLKTVKKQH